MRTEDASVLLRRVKSTEFGTIDEDMVVTAVNGESFVIFVGRVPVT